MGMGVRFPARTPVRARMLALLAALSVTGTWTAEAAPAAQGRKADFLFGAPRGHVGIRGGFFLAAENSDVFDFFSGLLTVDSGAFSAPSIGFDVGLRVHPRVDVVFGLDFSRTSVSSEYREFVEDNDLPILQETRLTATPITGSAKLYLMAPGREISRHAFVPRAVVPYLGGGGGLVWYKLEQGGDFIDFVDLSIFTDRFQSDGFGLEYHAFGGVDVRVHPRLFLSIEARYLWADAGLDGDFIGFEPIDLSGLRSTVALNLSF